MSKETANLATCLGRDDRRTDVSDLTPFGVMEATADERDSLPVLTVPVPSLEPFFGMDEETRYELALAARRFEPVRRSYYLPRLPSDWLVAER